MMSETEARDALLPCPFCGGEAALYEGHHDHWKVRCKDCTTTTSGWFAYGGAKAKAITAWNTRSPTPLPAAERGWRNIASAPTNTPVEVQVGHMTLIARLVPDASMTSAETSCDQWQAEHEGEHPPCWSEGCCWESNEDEVCSLQPSAWRPRGHTA